MLTKQEFHITITNDGKTAVEWLAEVSGLSRQKLKIYMRKGCVWLERVESPANESKDLVDPSIASRHAYIQRLRRAKKVLNENQVLHFYYDESVLDNETPPAILIKDLGDYSIWNKPSGMLSGSSTTAQAVTGPAHGPLPTSSIPAMRSIVGLESRSFISISRSNMDTPAYYAKKPPPMARALKSISNNLTLSYVRFLRSRKSRSHRRRGCRRNSQMPYRIPDPIEPRALRP